MHRLSYGDGGGGGMIVLSLTKGDMTNREVTILENINQWEIGDTFPIFVGLKVHLISIQATLKGMIYFLSKEVTGRINSFIYLFNC